VGGDGGPGGSNRKHGKDAVDVSIPVPVGTQVYAVDEATGGEALLADLAEHGQKLVVSRGGRGGLGNARFVGPTNQEPLLAEAGDEGEDLTLRLELKLLADIGIIGLPNAGKSSLIAAITAARPKVADYPFTTLEPVLGVVEWHRQALVAVDIPGLIEGAHAGAGLGHDFLRHVQRTRVLVHLVDGAQPDVVAAVRTINNELELFDPGLAARPQLLVVNKIDLPEVAARRADISSRLERFLRGEGSGAPHATQGPMFVSAATHDGLDNLVPAIFDLVDRYTAKAEPAADGISPVSAPAEEDLPVLRPRPIVRSGVEREGDAFRVTHRRAIRLANGSDLSIWKAQMQFHEQLRRMGVVRELERLGVAPGATVRIGDKELVWD
ncbi:MAG: GTPase ObgE, partial [Chloroflexi bacterium]|nr:GTPase ObgE [Chloroflexota bacterium]